MTYGIQINPSQVTQLPQPQASVDAQKAGELIASDTQSNPRVRQFAMFWNNMRAAIGRMDVAADKHAEQVKASSQFGARAAAQLGLAEPMSTVKPTIMDLDSHPEIAEELNKHRLRESRAAAELDAAIRNTNRAQIDLLRAFGFLQPEDFPANPQRPEDLHGDKRPQEPGEPMINPADKDASGLIWDSHAEFYDKIGALIGALQEQWLSKFQDAMAKFLEFYKRFSDIMEGLKPEASGDKGDVKIDFAPVREALKKLMAEYRMDSGALASFPSEEAAKAFMAGMGLPSLTVKKGADGTFKVMMDVKAVEDLIHSMPYKPGNPAASYPVTWDSAKYNAWLSSKDSNVEEIKHVSKVLGEKLSEATQKFDSIVKQLSATIETINRCDMDFVNGL